MKNVDDVSEVLELIRVKHTSPFSASQMTRNPESFLPFSVQASPFFVPP